MNAHDMKAIRDLGSPMFDAIADRIEAEIERLRTEGQKDYDDMRQFQAKYIEADQEVERLREQGGLLVEALDDKDAEVERLRALNESYSDLLHERDDEVERLRVALDRQDASNGTPEAHRALLDLIAKREAEVERLRTDYDEMRQDRDGWMAEAERLQAALEALLDRIDHEVESKRLIRRVSAVSPERCEWVEYQRARAALAEEVTPIHTDP